MKRFASVATIATLAGLAAAQNERQVQIRSIDFDAQIIELHNFAGSDVDLSGWRFCSHDFDQARRYTASGGFNGVTIEAGTSVFVHYDNDAPAGDPDRIDRSTLGGGFATPLDQDAFGLQIFFPDGNGNVGFGNSTLIADHIQWNINGQGTGSSEARTAQAVGQTLWSANGDFIATLADSGRIELIDLSGDIIGSPAEYAVVRSNTVHAEPVDGDLSDDPQGPTTIDVATGSNVVSGTVEDSNDTTAGDRDFITFTVPVGQELSAVTLLDWGTTNIGFIAVNSGSTGFVPSGATSGDFLAGVLVDDTNIGNNLLENLRDQSVTQNSLANAVLPAGDYTFVVQQTTPIVQSYAIDFVLSDVDCPADLSSPAQPGVPDGVLTGADFFEFLARFQAGDLSVDFSSPAQPGVPDGVLTGADFFEFLNLFAQGC